MSLKMLEIAVELKPKAWKYEERRYDKVFIHASKIYEKVDEQFANGTINIGVVDEDGKAHTIVAGSTYGLHRVAVYSNDTPRYSFSKPSGEGGESWQYIFDKLGVAVKFVRKNMKKVGAVLEYAVFKYNMETEEWEPVKSST